MPALRAWGQYVDSTLDGTPVRPAIPRGEGGVVLEHLRDQAPTTPPLEVAGRLRAHAQTALDHADSVEPGANKELRATLADAVAMAQLGHYRAAKIEGAVHLYRFDRRWK